MSTSPRLALGPILYYWSKQQVEEFYQDIADTPVDIVYLGETVCSKRRIMRHKDWVRIGENLEAQGKTVILSTLTLIEAASELSALKRVCRESPFTLEANDIAAVQVLKELGKPFVSGPSVNIYNSRTLKVLSQQGLFRWTLPVELSAEELVDFQRQRPDQVETEVFAWGRMPLAYSARCFTARAENLQKDDCQFRCLEYPDGLLLTTRENEEFLCINGIQTLSSRTLNLIAEIPQLVELGVDVIRISPQSQHTRDIVECFANALNFTKAPQSLDADLENWALSGVCNGYWHGRPGMETA